MNPSISRRRFLQRSAGLGALTLVAGKPLAAVEDSAGTGLDFPLQDLHVHLDNSTIDQVLALPVARTVKFGIVEHAGTKENQYPIVLSNDAELRARNAMLAGKPVFKGIQAEWSDWMSGFSRAALAELDYVLTDTMTFPGKDGRRVKLWEAGVEDHVDMANREAFMDRYVDWHVKIISRQPIDILGNASWLPGPLAPEYEKYWTPARMERVFAAALKYRVAIEISASFKLPRLGFLRAAKAAGLKFSFGSNGRYPNMGKLEYSIAMAKALGLTRADMFTPAPDGQKAVQRRQW